MRYTSSIGDWNVKYATPEEFHQQQLRSWGDPTFNACEYLEGNQIVRPFLDYDEELVQRPTAQELQMVQDRCKEALVSMFTDETGTFDYDSRVLMATRHGFKPSGAWKTSFRFVVLGFRLRMSSMKTLIRECSDRREDLQNIWDTSIYSSRRVSLCVR